MGSVAGMSAPTRSNMQLALALEGATPVATATRLLHPAKFSREVLDVIRTMLPPDPGRVVDPFAGVGGVHTLRLYSTGVEIEAEWARAHPRNICASALALPFRNATFDTAITSPTYGNRFADAHTARDGSRRRSYTHDLRAMTGDPNRRLHPDSSGALQWGVAYRAFHEDAWGELKRVLVARGSFILNVKNHVRNRREIDVVGWHIGALQRLGFNVEEEREAIPPGMRYGDNAESRANVEWVIRFRAPEWEQASRHDTDVRNLVECTSRRHDPVKIVRRLLDAEGVADEESPTSSTSWSSTVRPTRRGNGTRACEGASLRPMGFRSAPTAPIRPCRQCGAANPRMLTLESGGLTAGGAGGATAAGSGALGATTRAARVRTGACRETR
jgi:hypothetical protein